MVGKLIEIKGVVENFDNNVYVGVKYLWYLVDKYFVDFKDDFVN